MLELKEGGYGIERRVMNWKNEDEEYLRGGIKRVSELSGVDLELDREFYLKGGFN